MNSRQEKIESTCHLMMIIDREVENMIKEQKSLYERLRNAHELLITKYREQVGDEEMDYRLIHDREREKVKFANTN